MHKDLENNKEGSKIVSLVIIKVRGKFQYSVNRVFSGLADHYYYSDISVSLYSAVIASPLPVPAPSS